MAGNSGDIKKRLNLLEGLDPEATNGELWLCFLRERDILKETGKSSPQSRNREAEAKAIAYAKEKGIGSLAASGGPDGRPVVVLGDDAFTKHAKPSAELAQVDSAPSLDVRWVAANILNMDATPAPPCPSKAAWGLLIWARCQPAEFYRGPYTRLLPSKAQVDDETDEAGDDQLEEDCDFFIESRRLSALRKSTEGPRGEHREAARMESVMPGEQVATA